MFLTEEQTDSRLNSPDNLINIKTQEELNPTVKTIKWAGSGGSGATRTKNLTEEERIAVGVLGTSVGNQIAAETFGINPQTVSNIRNGNGTQSLETADKIGDIVGKTKKKCEEIAAERLLTALGFLSDDKMSNCSAKDLSSIASNISKVVQSLDTKRNSDSNGDQKVKVQIVLHQPKPAKEEHFDFIEVSA